MDLYMNPLSYFIGLHSVLCQCDIVFITVVQVWTTISTSGDFLFPRIPLAIQGLLCFHVSFKILFNLCGELRQHFEGDCTESVDGFW